MSWHNRFKAMKSELGLTNSDIAQVTGNSADSVKSVTQPNKEIPRWLKLAIIVYERMVESEFEPKKQGKKLPIHNVVCCGVLEKMNLGWMKLEDGTKCMPYIKGHSDENMYRVNNCPSCGKYVRDVMGRAIACNVSQVGDSAGLKCTTLC